LLAPSKPPGRSVTETDALAAEGPVFCMEPRTCSYDTPAQQEKRALSRFRREGFALKALFKAKGIPKFRAPANSVYAVRVARCAPFVACEMQAPHGIGNHSNWQALHLCESVAPEIHGSKRSKLPVRPSSTCTSLHEGRRSSTQYAGAARLASSGLAATRWVLRGSAPNTITPSCCFGKRYALTSSRAQWPSLRR
jgi:hypothetical protein